MNKQARQEIAQTITKNIKTEEDLNEFRHMLTKIRVGQYKTTPKYPTYSVAHRGGVLSVSYILPEYSL